MRLVAIAAVAACLSALVGCAGSEPQTSTFPTEAAASEKVPSSTSQTTSATAPAPAPETIVDEKAPAKEEPKTDDPAPAADDEPDWMKNCIPFVPCFPPDPPPPSAADACPPFDPICQTNAAMKDGEPAPDGP